VGSSIPISFAKKQTNVWKLDDPVDEDLIDEDELLDESDLIKPDAASLRGEITVILKIKYNKEDSQTCINTCNAFSLCDNG